MSDAPHEQRAFEQLLARANTSSGEVHELRFVGAPNLDWLTTPIYANLRGGRMLPQRRIQDQSGRGWAFVGDDADGLVVEELPAPTHDGPTGVRTTLVVGAFVVSREDWQDRAARSLRIGAAESYLMPDVLTAVAQAAKAIGFVFVCDHVDVGFARLRAAGPCVASLVFSLGMGGSLIAEVHAQLRGNDQLPARRLDGGDSDAWGFVGEQGDLVLGHRYYLSAADGETVGWALLVDDVCVAGSDGVDYGDSFHQITIHASELAKLELVVEIVKTAALVHGCRLRKG